MFELRYKSMSVLNKGTCNAYRHYACVYQTKKSWAVTNYM